MINWQATSSTFGYSSSADLIIKRPKVVCQCDQCSKLKNITIRVKSRIINEQMKWLCPACVSKNRGAEISAQLKKQWNDNDYIAARSQSSLQLWADDEYRALHSEKVKEAMVDIDMSTILLERYKDPAAHQATKDASIKAWTNQEMRAKHLKSMRSEQVRAIIGAKARARWTDADYRLKMAEIRTNQIGKISAIQNMLYNLLDTLNIEYYREGEKTKFGYYIFDCYIEQYKLLIECQGDYWHSLEKAQTRDKQKFTYIQRYFPQHKLVYFWEREFYENDRVISRLKSLLGIVQTTIDFSFKDINISTIDKTKYFLELYHYIGPGRGGTKIGAFIGETLIAVAVFSHPVRQNLYFPKSALECSRFCIHPAYHKKNFASWFISKCVKILQPTPLFAYADSTVGHNGTIYKAAGWKYDHEVPPDYWYIDQEGYIMHKKTLYNRAINLKMTESNFAIKYGFQKIVGGPKYCYTKNI